MTTMKSMALDREAEIKRDDRSDTSYVKELLTGVSKSIGNYLRYFMDKYSVDGVLGIAQMRKSLSNADIAKWQQFLNEFGSRIKGDEAEYWYRSAKKVAGYDREQLLNAMIQIATAVATTNITDYSKRIVLNEANKAMSFQNKVIRARGNPVIDVAEDVENKATDSLERDVAGLNYDQRAWLRSERLNREAQQAVTRSLNVGLDEDYYENHLFKEATNGNKNSVVSLFDSAGGYYSNTLLREHKAIVTTIVANYVALSNSLKKAQWHDVEDSHVCAQCRDLSSQGAFPANAVPARPHGGCRCFVVYYNEK